MPQSTDYKREYNKEAYKTVRVYVRKEDYPAIEAHFKAMGHNSLSGYIKALIQADMERVCPNDEPDSDR